MAGYTVKQQRAMKKMSPARRASFKKMLDRAPSIGKVRRARRNKSRRKKAASRRATPNRTTRKAAPKKTMRTRKGKRSTKRSASKTRSRALSRAKSTTAARRAAKKRPLKEQFIRRQMSKGRSPKQAAADWRFAYGRTTGAGKKRGRQARKYGGGKYKALRARYGPKSRWTASYKTKKGRVRDIPDHALLGYPSAAALRRAEKTGSEAERRRIARKAAKIYASRERGARKQYRRTMAGKDLFVPNAGDEILSFEEWKEMRPNAKRKGWTKAKRRAAGKKAAATRKRRARSGKRTGKRTAKRKASKRKTAKRGGWTKAKRRAAGKKAAATRKRKGRRKSGTTKKRKATKRKATKRRGKKRVSATTKRRISAALKRYHKTCRGGKKRKSTRRKGTKRRTARRNQGSYRSNRGYRRNVGGPEYMVELKNALKIGALVTVGIVAHRALTKVLSEQVLGKIDMFSTGAMGKYRGIISSVLTAMIGVPIVVRVAPKQAVPVAAGMAASLIHGALIEALSMAGQGGAAAYLSGYPNAEGSMYGHAIGSYYTTPGMGSYYSFSPHEVYSGFGQSPQLTQAAAGMGMTDAQLRQAAAGMGQSPMLTQAAAGMGQSPMLTQAAAGMGQAQVTQAAAGTGEYVAYGVTGIGEYDEVPTSIQHMNVDEGIYPNLHSAEQALSVAEGAAGVGSIDVPLQSTIDPTMIADPIADVPGGSRAGILAGGDGIFG